MNLAAITAGIAAPKAGASVLSAALTGTGFGTTVAIAIEIGRLFPEGPERC